MTGANPSQGQGAAVADWRKHPMPWKPTTAGGGTIVMLDAAGAVVELFTMIGFIDTVTTQMAAIKARNPAG